MPIAKIKFPKASSWPHSYRKEGVEEPRQLVERPAGEQVGHQVCLQGMPPPLMLQAQVKQGQVQELAPAPEVNKQDWGQGGHKEMSSVWADQ